MRGSYDEEGVELDLKEDLYCVLVCMCVVCVDEKCENVCARCLLQWGRLILLYWIQPIVSSLSPCPEAFRSHIQTAEANRMVCMIPCL